MSTGEWLECLVDSDYEINSEYPYYIRRKSNGKVVSESDNGHGYIQCALNAKIYMKHRIVAIQFVPNPNELPEVDHINHDKSDNRVENLRWVSRSENMRNCSKHEGEDYILHSELPETAERLESYNGHWFDGLYIDYENEKLYLFNGLNFREVVPRLHNGRIRYHVRDVDSKQRDLAHNVLFG